MRHAVPVRRDRERHRGHRGRDFRNGRRPVFRERGKGVHVDGNTLGYVLVAITGRRGVRIVRRRFSVAALVETGVAVRGGHVHGLVGATTTMLPPKRHVAGDDNFCLVRCMICFRHAPPPLR